MHTHTAHLPVLMFVYALSGHFWFNSTILLLFDMTCTHTVVMRSVWPLPGLTNSDTDNNIEVRQRKKERKKKRGRQRGEREREGEREGESEGEMEDEVEMGTRSGQGTKLVWLLWNAVLSAVEQGGVLECVRWLLWNGRLEDRPKGLGRGPAWMTCQV